MKQITLATLNDFTFQEIFDIVSLHLLTQHEKSLDSNGDCAYRGRNNTKCAIGCLISDEEYHKSMEGKLVSALKNINERQDIFLQYLQNIHDHKPVELWYEELTDFAKINNLEMKISKNKANFLKLVTNDGSGERFLERLKYRIENEEKIRESK